MTAVLEDRQISNTSFAEIAVLSALGGTVGDLGRLRRHGRGSRGFNGGCLHYERHRVGGCRGSVEGG
jgi:hypothetical protein